MSKYRLPPGKKREFRKLSGSREQCLAFVEAMRELGYRKSLLKKVIGCWLVVVERLVPA